MDPRWILLSRKYYEPRAVVTKKSEEFNLAKHSWIPTVGHQSLFKRVSEETGYILFMGGEQSSRIFGFSSYMFCQKIGQDVNQIWLEELTYKKPNQITSHNAGECMDGSILKNLNDFRWCDTLPESSNDFKIVLFGGESIENGTSQSDLYVLSGSVAPDLKVHCRKYTSEPLDVKGVLIPHRFCQNIESSAARFVQSGDKPGSRYGHCLLSLDEDSLFLFGGVRVPLKSDLSLKRTLSDMYILSVGSISWVRLDVDFPFERADFASETVNNSIVVFGGFTLEYHGCGQLESNTKLSEIVKVTDVKVIKINMEEKTAHVTNIKLNIADPQLDKSLYGCASCCYEGSMYVYGGFSMNEKCDLETVSLQDWHFNKMYRPTTSNTLYKIEILQDSDSIDIYSYPGTVNPTVGGGTLVSIGFNGVSLLSIGGSLSDLWLYTDKSFRQILCSMERIQGYQCKFQDPNFLTSKTLWVTCTACNLEFHAVCDTKNKKAHQESVKGIYNCVICRKKNRGQASRNDCVDSSVCETPPEELCYCGNDSSFDEVVECSMSTCKVKRFHLICVGLFDLPVDAWSCLSCSTSEATTNLEQQPDEDLFCFCRQPASKDNLIGCDGDNCEYEWFHYKCVKIERPPLGEWLCNDCK